jgi:hypothetical protein
VRPLGSGRKAAGRATTARRKADGQDDANTMGKTSEDESPGRTKGRTPGTPRARGAAMTSSSFMTRVLAAWAITGVAACGQAGPGSPGFSNDDGGGGAGSSSGGSDGSVDAAGDDGGGFGNLVGDGSASDGGCPPPDPGNYDIPGNGCDDDGDGKVDDTPVCDKGLALTGSAGDFVKALGLCQTATGSNDPKWGVVSAAYTQGYAGATGQPDPSQHGILGKFGAVWVPREGFSLGTLSSGYARAYDDPSGTSTAFKDGDYDIQGVGAVPKGAPPGYPKAAKGCPIDSDVYDPIALTVTIKVPLNAKGFQFDFNFGSGEWPEWVCSHYNDSFVAWLKSAAWSGNAGDLNISFDSQKNPVSVNNGFFQVCSPSKAMVGCQEANNGGYTQQCPLGSAALKGTGFDDSGQWCGNQTSSGGGATAWLTTKAPAKPGEVLTVQFIVWNTGDGNLDSSVLLDHWVWQPGPTSTGTMRPPQ